MRDDAVYLDYIAENIEIIEEYLQWVEGLPEKRLFSEDQMRQDAVLRRLETLGEAASHLSTELRARHPEIDWRKIVDFRNILAHGYMNIQTDRVWNNIVEDLPALKAVIGIELEGKDLDA